MGFDPFGTKAAKKIKKAAAAAAAAAKEAAAAQAEAFRFNAAVYERNADLVEEQGLIDEARNRRQGSRFLGEQNAAIAASGFQDVGFEGIREDTERELDLDAIIIRRQGQAAAADYEAQADLALMNADTAIRTGQTQAQQAILEGSIRAGQAQSSAITGTAGLVIGGAGLFMKSDARIKEHVQRVGTLPTGHGLYAFNYVWEPPALRRIGAMAQEVQETHPEAVRVGEDGILEVDYGRIGLPAGYNLASAIGRWS
jgi:hypothetical protein